MDTDIKAHCPGTECGGTPLQYVMQVIETHSIDEVWGAGSVPHVELLGLIESVPDDGFEPYFSCPRCATTYDYVNGVFVPKG